MPKKYKVTFTGPRYAIGHKVHVQGVIREIVYCYCGLEAQRDEFGGTLYQAQWWYRLAALDHEYGSGSDTVNEATIMRWEEKP